MTKIKTFPYKKDSFDQIRDFQFGRNWPVVYIIRDKKEIYVGQTVNAYYRCKQHYDNPERSKLKEIDIITDEEFNISAAFDIESWLIQYISADEKFIIQNSNGGLRNHNYYDKVKYKAKFELVWESLRQAGLVKNTLEDLKNSDLFKYSPYKSLTEDQYDISRKIFNDIKNGQHTTFIVKGKPGTGKTILATYLFKYLKDQEGTKNMNIGLVVPMTSLRTTIKRVFSKIKGLKSSMVIGPNDVTKGMYDLLIIDESHRLQRRKGIMGYGAYDNVNRRLNLDENSTQLDWVVKSSKYQIFLYDENQSIKPADVRKEDFKRLNAKIYELRSQMRVEAGEQYISFIEDVFDLKTPSVTSFPNYDFRIFDNAEEMVSEIKEKDEKHKLARVVSGYAWPWHTKPGNDSGKTYDIDIGDLKLVWNSVTQDWVNSPNAVNEVGCIHTVQGYDLNYVGVIIGPEFTYDPYSHKFVVNKEKYFDINGRNGITDPNELEKYIINIYKTLLTRGIKGTYIYIVDPELRKYFNSLINNTNTPVESSNIIKNIESPYSGLWVNVPLFDSVGCGELMYADSTVQEMIPVNSELMSKGSKYFVLRTSGDSMNKIGINDGDLVLCRKNYHPSDGDIVVALIGDDATIKKYHKEGENVVLSPMSDNPKHQPLRLSSSDDVRVQGVFVRVLAVSNNE